MLEEYCQTGRNITRPEFIKFARVLAQKSGLAYSKKIVQL
jgi:hypothetical protein